MTNRKLLLLSLLAAACSAAPDESSTCTGAKCDDVTETAKTSCDAKFADQSGRSTKVKPGQLNDPIAKAIFKTGDGCPLAFGDIMKKLRETDKNGCDGEKAGLKTRLVSERSQTRGVPDSYRGVVTRQYDGRPEHALIFSLFGLSANGDLPDDVEIIAFDSAKGAFNYYAVENGKWNYHGDSTDMLDGPGDDGKRRCANCHVGGGLVMKELESPWLHWEGDTTTPGAADLVMKHADMGSKTDGINMESVVRAGNRAWLPKRVEALKKKSVKELLKPLFCTMEINLHEGTSSTSPVSNDSGSDLSRVPADFLVDNEGMSVFDSVSVNGADYRAQVAANGQKMTGSGGSQLKDKDGKAALDTIFDFVFPKRSAMDAGYTSQLVTAGILDDDFVKDALIVDFTRPVFSDDRCGLLDFAPTLDEKDLTPDKIRDGFIAKLQAAKADEGTPAAVFLKNLQTKNDASAHAAQVSAFFTACKARDSKQFLADAMQVSSLKRNQARELTVLEFPETLPVDNLDVAAGTRLDPKTCELATAFVAP